MLIDFRKVMFFFTVFILASSSPAEQNSQLPLTEKLDGIEGSLEVVSHKPHGRLLFRSKNGIQHQLKLEKATAKIETKDFDGANKRLILVTQDFTAEFGSYNGPITKILKITSTGMSWVKALNQETKKEFEISLMKSLKSAWSFAPTSSGQESDLLKVKCEFDENAKAGFITTYSRIHLTPHGWIMSQRHEDAAWENEALDSPSQNGLPDIKKFPN